MEGYDRGYYAGPVGWVDANGDAEFVVAIRSALLGTQEVTLYAGAGIVAGSDATEEWRETCSKLTTMRQALRVTEGEFV